jgi:hypothetical protein
MAFGKTQEQKALEAEAKARADVVRREEKEHADALKARAAFLASPVGEATTAKEQRQGFFEIQLNVGSSQRDSTIWGGNNSAIAHTKTESHAGTLAAIEAVGWQLEHVGYIFMITGESSRDKFLASGQQTAVSGQTVGIYLFRNTDAG